MLRASSPEELTQLTHLASTNPDYFWDQIASSFHWYKKYTKISEGTLLDQKYHWFSDGETNISVNCLDRHLPTKATEPALIWEPNQPTEPSQTYSYQQLSDLTNQIANGLRQLGIQKGDRVVMYAPMRPETIASMLACSRIGAIHAVVFAGFSAQALADRLLDTQAKLIITADQLERGEKTISLQTIVNEARQLANLTTPALIMGQPVHSSDIAWDSLIPSQLTWCEPVHVNSEDPAFILYTSGSTGKPKGLVHTTGGYMVYAQYSFENVFQPQPNDVFWCTADVGWITGHTYLVYGPLLAGATTLVFAGTPTYPDPSRFWQVIARHRVSILYTAPTVIRSLAAQELSWLEGYDLSSLRVLGSVGEPLNAQAWHWYHTHVGQGRCPLVDTWWQTETGGIMISSMAGITQAEAGTAGWPLPGINAQLVSDAGQLVRDSHQANNLTISSTWPSLARGIWGDQQRFAETYFARFPATYWTGDGAYQNVDGSYRITGRVDDVINVSGHRIGTAEVESALTKHAAVVEAAVVGYPHPIKGEGLYGFVVCYEEFQDTATIDTLKLELNQKVTELIGGFARLDTIQVVPNLPKTRSGKIMRRLLRKLIQGESDLGDTSTLLEPQLLEIIKQGVVLA